MSDAFFPLKLSCFFAAVLATLNHFSFGMDPEPAAVFPPT